MNSYTELIDKYLNGEMTPGEKYVFEEQLDADHGLKAEFEVHRSILQGIEFAGARKEIHQGFKRGAIKNKARKWVIGMMAFALAVSMIISARNKFFEEEKESTPYTLAKAARLKKVTHQSSPLPIINVKNNITTKSVKNPSLYDGVGEEKPATQPEKTSGSTETSAGRENLSKDKPGEKTIVFGGKRMPDGQILWMGQRTLEAGLSEDSLALSVYAQRFLDSLKNAGADIKSHKLADSIYRSLRVSETIKILESDTTKK